MLDRLKYENSQLHSSEKAAKLDTKRITEVVREMQSCVRLMIDAADATANRLFQYALLI